MSVTAIVNKFDGGNAEDVRTENANECEYCDNFDVFTTPHKPIPFVDMVAETMTSGTTTDYALADVDSITVAGTTSLLALGRTALATNTPAFFRKNSSSDITSAWQFYASGVNNVVKNSLTIFRAVGTTDLRAYCLGDTAAAHNLQMFDGTATVTTVGTLTNTNYSSTIARPFVHPQNNVMYFADGNIVGSYDPSLGTPFTATLLTLPSNKLVVGFTYLGVYLVIICRPRNGIGNSTKYFWNPNTALTTLDETIDLGSSQVNIVENIENQLVVISTKASVGSYSNVITNKLTVKVYTGGAMTVVKEIAIGTGVSANLMKQKVGEKLYFALSGDTSIYVFGKNKNGQYFLTHNRGLPTGATSITSFSIIGDVFFANYATAGQTENFRRSVVLSESQAYTVTSVYRTTKNPAMISAHRSQLKMLQAVQWMYTSGSSAAVATLKYSVNGGAYTTIATLTGVTGEQVLEAANETSDLEFDVAREYSFQMEVTGGSSPGDLRYRYELLEQLT